jgi:hypothetical protein
MLPSSLSLFEDGGSNILLNILVSFHITTQCHSPEAVTFEKILVAVHLMTIMVTLFGWRGQFIKLAESFYVN